MKFQRRTAISWMMSPCILLSLLAIPCHAQDVARISSAVAFSSKGTVSNSATKTATEIPSGSSASTVNTVVAKPAAIDPVQPGGKLTTGADGATSLILGSTGTARMGADTEIQLPDAQTKDRSLEMLKGRLFLNISAEELAKRKAGEFRLKTPAALLAVKGTKFFAVTQNGSDIVGVNEGIVAVFEPVSKTTLTLSKGQAVTVSPGKISAPRPMTDEESGYTTQYSAANIVQTPLALIVSQDPQKGFCNGVNGELTSKSYSKFIDENVGLFFESESNFSQRGVVNVTDYSNTICTSESYLWTKNKKLSASIGPVIAIQFKLRCNNLSVVRAVISDRREKLNEKSAETFARIENLLNDKNAFKLTTPALSTSGRWSEFLVTNDSKIEDINFIILNMRGKADGIKLANKNLNEKRVLEFTDFVLLSLPK